MPILIDPCTWPDDQVQRTKCEKCGDYFDDEDKFCPDCKKDFANRIDILENHAKFFDRQQIPHDLDAYDFSMLKNKFCWDYLVLMEAESYFIINEYG